MFMAVEQIPPHAIMPEDEDFFFFSLLWMRLPLFQLELDLSLVIPTNFKRHDFFSPEEMSRDFAPLPYLPDQ